MHKGHRALAPRLFGVLLCLLSPFLFATPGRSASPSDQYLLALHNNPVREGLTLDAASKDPAGLAGQTLEIEGRLLGVARSGENASLMIATARNGTINLRLSRLPDWVHSGQTVRALVVITQPPERGTVVGMPQMEVVALASAADISVAETRWRAEAAARAERERWQREAIQAASAMLRKHPVLPATTPAPVLRGTLASRGAGPARAAASSISEVYGPYRAAVRSFNSRLSEKEVDAITTAILGYSEQQGVDPRLVIALIIAESSFNPQAKSRAGAMGLGQIMPATAREIGLKNPYDPVQNIAGAVYLLRVRLDKYSGNASSENLDMEHIILALASYNAGMGAVKKHGGVPPYRETQNYVRKVEQIYRSLCGEG